MPQRNSQSCRINLLLPIWYLVSCHVLLLTACASGEDSQGYVSDSSETPQVDSSDSSETPQVDSSNSKSDRARGGLEMAFRVLSWGATAFFAFGAVFAVLIAVHYYRKYTQVYARLLQAEDGVQLLPEVA